MNIVEDRELALDKRLHQWGGPATGGEACCFRSRIQQVAEALFLVGRELARATGRGAIGQGGDPPQQKRRNPAIDGGLGGPNKRGHSGHRLTLTEELKRSEARERPAVAPIAGALPGGREDLDGISGKAYAKVHGMPPVGGFELPQDTASPFICQPHSTSFSD